MTAYDDTKDAIHRDFYAILNHLGYVHSPSYSLYDKPEVARAFGKALHDYMVSAIFDTDWEGFPDEDVKGVAALMADLRIAVEHGLLE